MSGDELYDDEITSGPLPSYAMRPVDRFPVPGNFAHDRMEARRLVVCAKCGEPVDVDALAEIDRREYLISAICPRCFDAIFPPEDLA